MSGYTQCACRDCFDITISSDETVPELCSDCEDAGCDAEGCDECQRDDAYGVDEDACPDCGEIEGHNPNCPASL